MSQKITEKEVAQSLLDSAYVLITQQEDDESGQKVESLRRIPLSVLLKKCGTGTGTSDGEVDPEVVKQIVNEYLAGNTPAAYTLPIATETTLGGVKAAAATEEMTQPVGITAEGKLVTVPGQDSGGNAAVETGWTTEQINLLDQLFDHIPFKSDEGGDIADALIASLRSGSSGDTGGDVEDPDTPVTPEKTLTSISAVYSGGSVPVGTAVTALTGVVVTAHYSDGSTATVTGYTLSGTIAEGSNTVTVTYQDKTTTFSVTGVAESGGDEPGDSTVEIPADATRLAYIESTGTQYIDTGYQPAAKDTVELTMETAYAGTSAGVDWFGVYDGTNFFRLGTNLAYVFWGRCVGACVSAPRYADLFGESGNALKFKIISNFNVNLQVNRECGNAVYYDTDGTEIGSSSISAADRAVFDDIAANMYLFANNDNGTVGRHSSMKLYECIFRDVNSVEVHHYVPVKDGDGVVCLYDTVDKKYLYNAGTGDFVGGEAA